LNVWLPGARPEYVTGLEQLAKALPSTWHWKVAGSLAVKLKVAEVELVGLTGFVPMVVVGGVLSIAIVCLAEFSVLPATSIARAST
jgi:hypothetical protein